MSWDQRPRDPQEQHGFELIGALIKRRRVALGWSQRFLEAQSGIDQTVISRIENGKQYGLRWARFANLVDSLGGLGPVTREPWPGVARRQTETAEPELSSRRSGVIDLSSGDDDLNEAV